MILLNTTFFIEKSIEIKFTQWARTHFIPELKAFGANEIKFLEILSEDPGAVRLAVQAVFDDAKTSDRWQSENIPALLQKAFSNGYGIKPEQMLHFTSAMKVL